MSRYESIVKKIILISLLLPLSGCLEMFALYPTGPKRTYKEKEKNDYTVGVGNHSGKDIYIESIAIDGKTLDKQRAYLYCSNRLDVNGYSYLVELNLDTSLPKDSISVVWDPLTGEGLKEVNLKIPKTNFITRYVEKYKGRAYLYADIREGDNVWLRLSHIKSRLENTEDVFILAKARATPLMEVRSLDSQAILAKQIAIKKANKRRLSDANLKAQYIDTIKKIEQEIKEYGNGEIKVNHDGEVTDLERKIIKSRQTKNELNRLEKYECWSEEEKISYMSGKLNIPKDQFLFNRWYPGAPQNEHGSD